MGGGGGGGGGLGGGWGGGWGGVGGCFKFQNLGLLPLAYNVFSYCEKQKAPREQKPLPRLVWGPWSNVTKRETVHTSPNVSSCSLCLVRHILKVSCNASHRYPVILLTYTNHTSPNPTPTPASKKTEKKSGIQVVIRNIIKMLQIVSCAFFDHEKFEKSVHAIFRNVANRLPRMIT